MSWGNEEESVSEVTVAQFDELADQIARQRAKCDALAADLKAADKELTDLETKMMALLDQTGRDKWQSQIGTMYISQREYVSPPKEVEDKKRLFKYLEEKGVLYEYLTVNPQSLTAFYKAEKEQAEKAGEYNFKLPGVGDPFKKESLGFRKAK